MYCFGQFCIRSVVHPISLLTWLPSVCKSFYTFIKFTWIFVRFEIWSDLGIDINKFSEQSQSQPWGHIDATASPTSSHLPVFLCSEVWVYIDMSRAPTWGPRNPFCNQKLLNTFEPRTVLRDSAVPGVIDERTQVTL